jgi:hypothetical protein
MSSNRKTLSLIVSMFAGSLLATGAFAQSADSTASAKKPEAAAGSARKSCEDLKLEIDGKLKAKGVKTFTLDIVPSADVKDARVVGNCEGGSKKITYKRG